VDNDGAFETRLEGMLVPGEIFVVHVILLENLFWQFNFILILSLIVSVSLLFCGILSLVLQIESDGLLEIAMNGTALVLTFEGIHHLDVDLGSVERTVTVVESPWPTELVQSNLKGRFSVVPLRISAETLFRSG